MFCFRWCLRQERGELPGRHHLDLATPTEPLRAVLRPSDSSQRDRSRRQVSLPQLSCPQPRQQDRMSPITFNINS